MLLAECSHVFFFNDTATTEIYTLSLHDALPIYRTPQPQIPMERCIWAPLLEFVPDGNGSEAGCGEVFQRFQQRSLIQSRSRIQKSALRFRSRARQLRLCSMRRWPDVPVTSRPGD